MKKRVIVVVLVIVLILVSIMIIGIKNHLEKHPYDFKITTTEISDCSGIYEYAYKLTGGKEVYTYCLENITVDVLYKDDEKVTCTTNDCSLTLSEFIKNEGSTIMNKIYSYMTEVSLNESTIYTSDKKSGFTNNGLKIVVCNTEKNTNDIFIGPLSMDEDIVCNY